jgi:mRNA deadenylase 3'-5' endonuclease subunit Ccr4
VEKEKKRIELGLPDPKINDSPESFNHKFMERPMLRIPVEDAQQVEPESAPITVMTYNVLAQALIQRRIFPASGTSLTKSLLTHRRRPQMEKSIKSVNKRIHALPTYHSMHARS